MKKTRYPTSEQKHRFRVEQMIVLYRKGYTREQVAKQLGVTSRMLLNDVHRLQEEGKYDEFLHRIAGL